MELDEIIYNALTSDDTLSEVTGGRIYSTCIEVPPTDKDNTDLPYIVIAEENGENDQGTKDNIWESATDIVNVGVIINDVSPNAVRTLRKKVREAIESYVANITTSIPYLRSLVYDGIAWDWTKPCYYDTLHYQCDIMKNSNE